MASVCSVVRLFFAQREEKELTTELAEKCGGILLSGLRVLCGASFLRTAGREGTHHRGRRARREEQRYSSLRPPCAVWRVFSPRSAKRRFVGARPPNPNPSIMGPNDVGGHGDAPLHPYWPHPGGVGVGLALPAGRRPAARGRQAVPLHRLPLSTDCGPSGSLDKLPPGDILA